MSLRRPYSQINLTSLLDVVFLTLYILVMTMGDSLRATNRAVDEREQAVAVSAMAARVAAEETVSALQSAAQATATAHAQSQMATATSAALDVAALNAMATAQA